MPKKYPTSLIIVCMVLFYPVAIFMIISNTLRSSARQQENSRTAGYTNPFTAPAQTNKKRKSAGRGATIAGWILLPIGIITLLPMITNLASGHHEDISGILTIFVMFIVGGIALLSLGARTANKEKHRRQYVQIVNNSPDLSIASIAREVGRSEATVRRELSEMLAEGYFPNCYIDPNKMEFCLPRVRDAKRHDYRTAAVSCNSCGAKTTLLAGTVKRCEYCGSPLSANLPPAQPLHPYGANGNGSRNGQSYPNYPYPKSNNYPPQNNQNYPPQNNQNYPRQNNQNYPRQNGNRLNPFE